MIKRDSLAGIKFNTILFDDDNTQSLIFQS